MNADSLPLIAAVFFSATVAAHAQNVTVQQPVFNFNTVNTTVTAPDGGTVGLGGVKRASYGRAERGVPILGKLPYLGRLFNNRGIGQDLGHSYTTVSPRIIILEEEEAKLGLGDFGSGGPTGGVLGSSFSRGSGGYHYTAPLAPLTNEDHRALRLSQHVAVNQAPVYEEEPAAAGPSLEEIRRRNEAAAAQRDVEAVKFFEKGAAAQDAGKASVAKIYLQMAARRASGDFKAEIEAKLQALAESQAE